MRPRAVVKRKILTPCRESKPRTPIVQPVSQRYNDWAVTALPPRSGAQESASCALWKALDDKTCHRSTELTMSGRNVAWNGSHISKRRRSENYSLGRKVTGTVFWDTRCLIFCQKGIPWTRIIAFSCSGNCDMQFVKRARWSRLSSFNTTRHDFTKRGKHHGMA